MTKVFISKEILKSVQNHYAGAERPHIAGLWVDVDENRIYATNGHQLSAQSLRGYDVTAPTSLAGIINTIAQDPIKAKATIPMRDSRQRSELLKNIKKLFAKQEQITITAEPHNLKFHTSTENGDVSYNYPSARDIHLASDDTISVTLDRKYFISALTAIETRSYPTCELEIRGEHIGVMIRAGGHVEVVMPIRT